jgi:peptidoglycan/xylan/chitin deacetylase (PgdA/CDA1 family)
MNGTSTTFNGPAANTQSFIMNVGSSYSITEATSTNSKDYTVALAPSCTGVIGTSTATCTITNTFVPPVINFILNPSMETAGTVAGFPDKWTHGGWGTNNAVFTYPAAGVNGGVGANITFTSYTDGDAKWYFNDVAVASNTSYTFSDSYNANVPTILMAQFTSKTGVISYAQVSSLPATNGAWSTASTTISTPADVATVTIFHMLTSVGSLTTDNYSLAPTVYDPATLFSTGLVSLTFDDGWQSQYDNAFPILQAANLKGSFYIISDGMLNSQEVIFPNAGNPLNVVATPTSATWPQIYTDPSLHAFNFSNTYTATGPSTITVSYTLPGGAASSSVVGTLPAGTNATGTISFVLPAINGPITISQVVANTDTLTTSNPLLTESVGYLDTNHVLAMQAAGHEIGNHTVNHCDLVALENNANNVASCAYVPPPSTTPQQQIVNARNALLSAGLTPIDTLAYPYGSGAGDTNIENIVKTNGMIAARGVATGYNTKLTDHFALLDQNIMSNTDPVTIHGWIDYAIANKVWLIITYHQVETSASTLAQNGEVDGTTSAVFQDTVNYLSAQQAAGKVHVDTTHNIMTQFMN